MNIARLLPNLLKTVKTHSPEILTALGVSGVISTAYLTAKATFKSAKLIEDKINYEEGLSGPLNNADAKIRIKAKTTLVWKEYIPPAISGVASIACIIGASKAQGRRTAAAVTAYSLTERAFSEYKEKVVEQIGKGKEQKIRDEIAQDRVNKTPPPSKEVVMIGPGQVLCCELYTHRYFRSDMETLRRVQNDINARINSDKYVPLFEFYELVGLPYTTASNELGWDSDKQMELVFSTVLSEQGEPCLSFDYNYVKPI
jgi:hypothetical protein